MNSNERSTRASPVGDATAASSLPTRRDSHGLRPACGEPPATLARLPSGTPAFACPQLASPSGTLRLGKPLPREGCPPKLRGSEGGPQPAEYSVWRTSTRTPGTSTAISPPLGGVERRCRVDHTGTRVTSRRALPRRRKAAADRNSPAVGNAGTGSSRLGHHDAAIAAIHTPSTPLRRPHLLPRLDIRSGANRFWLELGPRGATTLAPEATREARTRRS